MQNNVDANPFSNIAATADIALLLPPASNGALEEDWSNNNFIEPTSSKLHKIDDGTGMIKNGQAKEAAEEGKHVKACEVKVEVEETALNQLRKLIYKNEEEATRDDKDANSRPDSEEPPSGAAEALQQDSSCDSSIGDDEAGDNNEGKDDDDLGDSTSCSSDSFEVASSNAGTLRTHASSNDGGDSGHCSTLQSRNGDGDAPGHSLALHAEFMESVEGSARFEAGGGSASKQKIPNEGFSQMQSAKARQRENPFLKKSMIEAELNSLDTHMPEFNFEKLEQQLTNAAKERELSQQKVTVWFIIRFL